MVRHQWQQQLIQHELRRWQNNEKSNPNQQKVYQLAFFNLRLDDFSCLVIIASNDINLQLSSETKTFIEKVHNAYTMHLKVKINALLSLVKVKQR